ncbi:MAG: DegT/DnrJ/EryC1/StrS family aminotransferase [Chitinispirillaceae bacterium]
MPIGWNLPPAASPISCKDLLRAIGGGIDESRALKRFSQSVQQYFGVDHVFLVSSGTAAVSLVLKALKQKNTGKDCVITPAYSCYSVLSAIHAAKLRPAFCDVDPQTLDFDYDDLSRCLCSHKNRTVAIIAAHLYGIPASISRIRSIIGQDGPPIIEDAAQAMGACFSGTLAGASGDIGVFSLGRGKAVSAVEGGIILTNNPNYALSLRRVIERLSAYSIRDKTAVIVKAFLMTAFLPPSRYWVPMGLPFLRLGETIYTPLSFVKKMSGAQAGLMADWPRKLSMLKSIRKRNAEEWMQHIPPAVTDTFKDLDLGALIRYPTYVSDKQIRQNLLSFSSKTGLGLRSGYPSPISSLPSVSNHTTVQRFAGAQTCCDHLVTLPNHQYVTRDTFALVKHIFSELGQVSRTRMATNQDNVPDE